MGFPGVEQYQRQAEQLGLSDRVSFPGRIPYPEAHRYLALGDIAVAPKMSLTEGNGKIYNYMAMGLPVVAFDAEPNREILGDLGVYARQGDETDFAAKVIDLLLDPERGRELGAKLREHAVESLSWNARIHELLAVYERVLPHRSREASGKFASSPARRTSTDD
jgi:glycosyltransferase involved in cell wall biosynthesis